MRINQPKRIYMNEADASPGNGAVATAAAPAEPAATTQAPAVDLDALVGRIGGMIDEKIKASQNATHAALRKAGVFKQEQQASESTTQQTQSTQIAPTQAQAGLSLADVEALLERKGVIATRTAKHGLSESQAKRFEAAMASVSRESLVAEADAYLTDMGLVKAATQAAATAVATQTTAQPARPNVSDRGSAAPTDTRDSEGILHSRPLEMNGHDVDALILKHGEAKGLAQFQEHVLAALSRVRIKPPNGGRQR